MDKAGTIHPDPTTKKGREDDLSTGASATLGAEESLVLAKGKLEVPDSGFSGIVGRSAALRRVLDLVEMVAPSDSTVLLLGDTGTGKELIARAVHDRSRRRTYQFVKLNCAAIPTGLLESELFGHERGAFTGAITHKTGRVELAHRGSLFLDEIGDIPLELQPKLLRVLQEREFERLGSACTVRVDTRVVAATHCDLPKMVDQGQFRVDLFYRLNVFPICLPRLRERPDDIPLLVQYFARQFAQRMDKPLDGISRSAMDRLIQYTWPGNVRELQNVIERAVIIHEKGLLSVPKSWLREYRVSAESAQQSSADASEMDLREAIEVALAESRGRISGPSGAAAKLGMPPSTLEWKIRVLNVNKYSFKFPRPGRNQSDRRIT